MKAKYFQGISRSVIYLNYPVPPLYLVRSKKETRRQFSLREKRKEVLRLLTLRGFWPGWPTSWGPSLGKKIQEGLGEKATHRAHSAESCACNNNKKKKKKSYFLFFRPNVVELILFFFHFPNILQRYSSETFFLLRIFRSAPFPFHLFFKVPKVSCPSFFLFKRIYFDALRLTGEF
jgi:hypothetical protein